MNASARYALPFNSHAQLAHLHDRATHNDSERKDQNKKASKTADEMKPRESTRAKFSRKMQSLFAGKKERGSSQEDAEAQEERKKGLMRRLMGNDAMLHAGRARFGRL